MVYAHIANFRNGLDRRGSQLTGPPGSLWTLANGHLNRRGEIERRKKFVAKYALPAAGTYGLHDVNGTRYVFGHGVDPGVPAGITYQRLQHPDGSTAMSAILSTESYDGKVHAVAEFSDGNKYHFYNGTLINAWADGIVRADHTNNDGIAEHLKALVDALTDYSATRAGAVVTITGPVGEDFTVTTEAEDGGGTDDQTAATALTQSAVAGTAEVPATGSFSITAGDDVVASGSVELTGGGSGSVDGITVNGVSIMSGAEAFDTNLATTAQNVVDNINAHTSSPNYSAELTATSTVKINAAAGTGTGPNGFVVVSSTTTITTTDTNLSGGINNQVTLITVDGVSVLTTAVPWVSSNSVTAANVATQITTDTSSPEYTATAVGAQVIISAAAGSGDSPNGFTIAVTVDTAGGATITADIPIAMAGGVDAVSGQAQKSTVTIGGTFEATDRFSIILEKGSDTDRVGVSGNPTPVGTALKTHKDKMYTTASSLIYFSSVGDVTDWNRFSSNPGASFINAASYSAGSQTLTAIEEYQGTLALFSKKNIQIWSMDADPALNAYVQTLDKTGTRGDGSVQAYGNNDVFYLSNSGVRSIRARDSSNTAYVSDVGTSIDPLVIDYMATLTDAQIEGARSVLEPTSDRYWLTLGSRIFVFTFFPGSEISAWSYYDTTDDIGADIDWIVESSDRIYARAGDTIYLYGGDNDDTYPSADEIECVIEGPFEAGGKPATKKQFTGLDIGCEGVWLMEAFVDPVNGAEAASPVKITVGTTDGSTYDRGRNSFEHEATHFAPRFVCAAAGYARLMDYCIHWDDPHEAG